MDSNLFYSLATSNFMSNKEICREHIINNAKRKNCYQICLEDLKELYCSSSRTSI
ncbi:7632_t:CDS:2 [Funneliformis mosseae]|uniref:7632_t:CDS:1 n=1 Tax=Funneliformis mosseae TaxID=27381 RepID=A0A9N9A3S3_FUNMO|nr:7632_t:CDS:2 [Funneliformis mosseae]